MVSPVGRTESCPWTSQCLEKWRKRRLRAPEGTQPPSREELYTHSTLKSVSWEWQSGLSRPLRHPIALLTSTGAYRKGPAVILEVEMVTGWPCPSLAPWHLAL